jgi:hypothetical protein
MTGDDHAMVRVRASPAARSRRRNARDTPVFLCKCTATPSDVTERGGRMTLLKVEPRQKINMLEEPLGYESASVIFCAHHLRALPLLRAVPIHSHR